MGFVDVACRPVPGLVETEVVGDCLVISKALEVTSFPRRVVELGQGTPGIDPPIDRTQIRAGGGVRIITGAEDVYVAVGRMGPFEAAHGNETAIDGIYAGLNAGIVPFRLGELLAMVGHDVEIESSRVARPGENLGRESRAV